MSLRHALLCVDEDTAANLTAAVRALGLSGHVRVCAAEDLARLRDSALLVIDPELCLGFDPHALEALRRQPRSALTRSPVVVILDEDNAVKDWRNAGAVPVRRRAGRSSREAALREAMSGLRRWVLAKTYIGPDRRRRRALVNFLKRRRSDGSIKVASAPQSTGTATAAVDVGRPAATIVRQLRCAGLEFGCASPARRQEFLDMVSELEQVAIRTGRKPLAKAAHAMKRHLRDLGDRGRLDDDEFESHLAAISFALEEPFE